jgi:hypothetical protein
LVCLQIRAFLHTRIKFALDGNQIYDLALRRQTLYSPS